MQIVHIYLKVLDLEVSRPEDHQICCIHSHSLLFDAQFDLYQCHVGAIIIFLTQVFRGLLLVAIFDCQLINSASV